MPATKSLPSAKHVGANIRNARQLAGITQLSLAHKIGYMGQDAGSYISRVESSTQSPRTETLIRIATALKVSVDSLLQTPEKTTK